MKMITPKTLVQAGLYPDEQSAVQEALRVLWQERPQVRIEYAVHAYRTQDISLSKAATFANVSFDRMKEILQRHGIQPRLGPETAEEALHEMKIIEQII